jgi:amphi-Trp domain-containing protein
MKKKKLHYTELRSLDSAIEQLQQLVDGLRAGVVSLERGEQQLQLKPGAVLDFELSAERDGDQERFELTLEWRRQQLTIGSPRQRPAAPSRPQSMAVPAGRGLALRAEAERLFEEDESEPPLSSDDDYTLAPDDVDVPVPAGSRPDPALAEPVAVLPGQDELEAIEEEELDDEAVTVRHSSPPHGQAASRRASAAVPSDADWFERLYAEARTRLGGARPRLDEQRFAESLAAAGLEPQLQQELCSLARQADEEGRDRLFKERSISELIASTLSGAA